MSEQDMEERFPSQPEPQQDDDVNAVEVSDEEQEAFEAGQREFQQAPQRNNPYVTEEDQGMDMTPHVMGPPQYGSPDPRTAAARLVPIVDHPLAEEIAEDYGVDAEEEIQATTEPEEGEPDSPENATSGAKELADQENVDLSDVEGTGAGGRITKADVQEYLASQQEDEDTNE